MSKEKLSKIKKISGKTALILISAFLILININEIRKGNTTTRTIAGSNFKDMDYFTDFSLRTFDGGEFSAKDMKGYKAIVVNIWEPYCSSCLKELPELNELASEYKDKGLLIIALQGNAYVYPEDVELGDELIGEMDLSIPVLYADEEFSAEVLPYLNNSFPGTWVTDSDGNVLDMVSGAKSREDWAKYFDMFV